MGNKISNSRILSVSNAQKRFSSEEWEELDAGFSRLCNDSGLLEEREFRLYVLGLHVPAALGASLFHAFDNKHVDGISRKEFLTGISILLRGTDKERVALVFTVFDEDKDGRVGRGDVDKWLQICKQNMVDSSFVADLKLLFDHEDGSGYNAYGYATHAQLDFKKFEAWCESYFEEGKVVPAIIHWAWDLVDDKKLFAANEQALFRSKRGRDTSVPANVWTRQNENTTAFTEKEVTDLQVAYNKLRVASPNRSILELLREIFPPSTPADMLKRIALAFDADKNGEINAREFVTGMASCCRGSEEQKMRFVFDLYDTDKSGTLGKEDAIALVKSLWRITQINAAHQIPHFAANEGNSNDKNMSSEENAEKSILSAIGLAVEQTEHVETEEDGDADDVTATQQTLAPPALARRPSSIPAVDINNVPTSALNVSVMEADISGDETKQPQLASDLSISMTADAVDEMAVELAESMFAKHDANRDSLISFEEFLLWTQENELAKQFFTAIAAFTSVTLGLQLHDPRQERLLLEKHLVDVPLTAGEEVYILSSKWLRLWLDYVGLDLNGDFAGPQARMDTSRRLSKFLLTPTRTDSGLARMDSVDYPRSPTMTRQKSSLRPPDISNGELLLGFAQDTDGAKQADGDGEDLGKDDGDVSTAKMRAASAAKCLKPNLREGLEHDYVVVNKPVWKALQSWYGGQEIARKVISVPVRRASDLNQSLDGSLVSTMNETAVVELYPLVFFVKAQSLGAHPAELSCSRSSTLASLVESIAALLGGVDVNTVRVWDMYRADDPKLLSGDPDTKLEDFELATQQELYAEVQLENGRWVGVPRKRDELESKDDQFAEYKEPKSVKNSVNSGLSGFHNLGNTCFMNSAVQCLSQTRPLTDYFLSGFYKHEINLTNPLGHGGEIARSFGRTIRDLWAMKKYRSLGPRRLKNSVGKMNAQFIGQQQQDSSEFLTVLLDGLHEDLNRVLDKPYIALESSNGRPDHIVADEYWAAHVARNRSVVYDLFCGQLKSTLDFECGNTSITFDPYTCLSLPLPEPETKYISVTVIYDDATRVPTKYTIPVPYDDNEATIVALKLELSKLCGCPPKLLQIADIQRNLVWKFLGDGVPLSRVFSEQLYAYQVPVFPSIMEKLAQEEEERKKKQAEEEEKAAQKPPFVAENLNVGDMFDCKDTARKWLHAVVLEVKRSESASASTPFAKGDADNDDGAVVQRLNESDEAASDKAAEENAEKEQIILQTAQQRALEQRRVERAAKPVEVFLFIHYEGWASRWDEWLSTVQDAGRIAELDSRSQRSQGGGGDHRPYNRNAELAVPSDCVTIHCVHRRIVSETKKFFVSPFRTSLFSRPLLLFLSPQETTCQDLYRLVWDKTRRGETKGYAFGGDEEKDSDFYPPFVLKFVNRNGSQCTRCRWVEGCTGCEVPYTDALIHAERLTNDTTIAIEWNPRFMKHMDLIKMNEVWEHESVARCKLLSSEDNLVSIADCMTKFTIREVLEESPRCSKCKDFHNNTTKTLSVWSFPPIVTLHLKRLVQGRKLHTMVKAPLKNFDPRPFYDQYVIDHGAEIEASRKARAADDIPSVSSVSTDPSSLYDLYATVNHYGGSGSGHYTAYALSKSDGKWYVFDDSRVYELPTGRAIITSNTYMLFYQRKGLDGEASLDYLPKEIRDKLHLDGKKVCNIM